MAFGDLGALVSPAGSVGCWTRATGTQQPLKTPKQRQRAAFAFAHTLKRWTKLLRFVRRSLAFKFFALDTPLVGGGFVFLGGGAGPFAAWFQQGVAVTRTVYHIWRKNAKHLFFDRAKFYKIF
ncbi:hypothetical protein D5272_11550 [bacterium D16-76]|nr:hypothetical protein [bacterium D16-76]